MMRYRAAVAVTGVFFAAGVVLAVLAALGASPAGAPQADGTLLLLIYFAAILFGATLQVHESDESSHMVDVGGTAALALSITYALPAGPVTPGVSWVVGVSAAGLIGGGILSGLMSPVGLSAVVGRALPRVVSVAILATLVHGRMDDSEIGDLLRQEPGNAVAVFLLALVYLVLLLEAPLRAEFTDRETESRREAHLSALRESVLLGFLPASTAVLIALAQPYLGLATLPVLLLPLAFNQIAVRRHEELRGHSRQSVLALSRMPEAMGLVRPGHAARVARLAVRIARELDLGRREIVEIERAALLHDLGQVRLAMPVPSGATVLAAPADQEDIAAVGAAIARATGVLDAESVLIEAQSLPYQHHVSHVRTIPLGSRILKVANAYDDLRTGEVGGLPPGDAHAALERIYLGLGHEYDPRVVEALAETLGAGVSGPGTGAAEVATP